MSKKGNQKESSLLLEKGGIALSVKAGGMITQYLFVFVVARMLGPTALGSFTLSFTVLQLLAILGLLGLDNLLTRKVAAAKAADRPEDIKSAFITSIKITAISAVLLSIFLFIAAEYLANTVFHKPQLATHLKVMCFALAPFVFINIHAAAFRGMKNMIGFTLHKAIIPLFNVGFIFIGYYSALNISPTLGYMISCMLVMILYVIAWNKYSRLKTVEVIETTSMKEMALESLPMMITGSIFFILNWIDNLVIGIFRTELEVGLYDTAFKIASASAIILMAINAIQGPTFAEYHSKNDLSKLRESIFSSTKMLFYATLPFTILIIIFPEWILSFFGKEFEQASTALIILSIGNFFSSITGSVGILLQMTGHQKPYNTIILFAAFTSIILNIILVPRIGITGAAIASAAAKIIQNFAGSLYVYKKFGFLSIYIPGFTESKNKSTHTL
ncbi:MAG: flippase [Bacteroidetes bacterium]|nr:flippase [Bacteroidota bacterium]